MSDPENGAVKPPICKQRRTNRRSFPLVKPVDPAEPSRTFHPFKDLPFELRQQIWRLALPDARVVDINLSKQPGPTTSCLPPALFSVCRESRAIMLELYVRSFTTSQQPYGIYIRPSIDIIHLKPTCSIETSYCYCVECIDLRMVTTLGRYSDVDRVETVILWKSFSEYRDSPDVLYENVRYLQRILPGMSAILLAVHGDWFEFFGEGQRAMLRLYDDIRESRRAYAHEFMDRELPEVIAIREVEIRHMNWSWEEEEPPWPRDNEFDDIEEELPLSIWVDAVRRHMRDFDAEEQGACLQVFSDLSWKEIQRHLRAFSTIGDNEREKEEYVRQFYGLLDECPA